MDTYIYFPEEQKQKDQPDLRPQTDSDSDRAVNTKVVKA